jgi:hypothetical protein
MVSERRTFTRVQFGRGYTAKIMAIDGTWQRDCKIGDVSDTGAKLTIHGSVAGIDMQEFFLVLTASGSAHRRCKRIWLNGDQIGVRFLKDLPGQPRPPRRAWDEPARQVDPAEPEARG